MAACAARADATERFPPYTIWLGLQDVSGIYRQILAVVCVAIMALPARGLPAERPATPAEKALSRAMAAIDKEQFDAALEALDEAIRLDPKLAEAYEARGWIYSERDQHDKALADYDRAIALQPQNARAWCSRGHVKAALGELAAAVEDYSEAIRLSPKMAGAYNARAWAYSELRQYDKAIADYSRCIELEPAEPQHRIDRATCLTMLKRFEPAIADLDEAIRIDGNNARAWGMRGAARLHLGDYQQGAADLNKAIALNPQDAGANYKPLAEKPLSEEALRHGRQQVEQMLRDRPAMAEMFEDTAVLRQWAARKFAGEDFGEPIEWDPTPPVDSDAENVAPIGGRRGRIRVAALHQYGPEEGKPRNFEQLWAGAIFELHNINYARQFLKLHQQAARGEVTKEEFVAGIWRYEYQAAQKTRAFYVQVFLPLAAAKKLKTDPGLWFASWWEEADEALAHFADKSAYPWRPYARQYDWATVRRLYHDGKFDQTLKLLQQMLADKSYHDHCDVHLWIGRCYMEIGSPQQAIQPLTAAISIDPNRLAAYLLRGDAYTQLGEKSKAEADYKKARELRRR